MKAKPLLLLMSTRSINSAAAKEITRVIALKKFHSKTWMLALFLLPSVLIAQVKERQAGDTTFYKTLIPETKQGLLRDMSMIANMRFAFRNEFVDGDYTKRSEEHTSELQ